MIDFDYVKAHDVKDAISQIAANPAAKFIAGGTNLVDLMKENVSRPERLIDITGLGPELSYIRDEGNEISIGALTRHVELQRSELLAEWFPIFREAEDVIADPVVRNRGTIGGSLCQADPAEDLSAVCSAVKATVVIRGPQERRIVPMDGFHAGPQWRSAFRKRWRQWRDGGSPVAHSEFWRRPGHAAGGSSP